MTRPVPRATSALIAIALALTVTAACRRVPATIDLANDGEPVVLEDAPPASADDTFVPADALGGCEQLLLAVDEVVRQRGGRWNPHEVDAMSSYLFDQGLRSLYYYATQARGSLLRLSDGFAAPVFVSGPHGDHPNYASSAFGHYNPVFVERLLATARALAQDPARIERTRPAFERLLRRQAQTYLLVHQALHHNPAWYDGLLADYEASIAGGGNGDVGRFHEFRTMLEGFEAAGMTWYETDTAIWFWLRRDLDGTATLWRDAVAALLQAYGAAPPGPPPVYPVPSGS